MTNSYTTLKLLLFAISLLPVTLLARQQVLTGQVVDKISGAPLKGADVYLVINQQGDVADEDGYFRIEAASISPADTLVISFVGYRDIRTPVSRFQNRSRIALQPISVEQDSILVRADRIDLVKQEIPHAREVINFEAIEVRGTSEMSDLFKALPSVRVRGNDISGRQVQIRGTASNEVNVYIDGILINYLGLDNAADLSLVALSNVERIEVLKGANLPLLGGGAFGGVVNITTRKNLDPGFYAQTKQGSFNSQYYVGSVNYPFSRNLVLNYSGQYNTVEPPIFFTNTITASADTVENNELVDTQRQNHNLSLNYYFGAGELTAKAFGYLLDYNTSAVSGETVFPLQNKRNNYLLNTSYKGTLLGVRNLDISLSYLLGDDELERENPVAGDKFSTTFTSDILSVRLLKKFEFGKNEFQFLGEYFHDELETREQIDRNGTVIPTYGALLYENRWSTAGVMSFENNLAKRKNVVWKTHLGLRADIISNGESYLSPTGGIKIDFTLPVATISPYGNFGKNVKVQSLRDNAYALFADYVITSDSVLQRFEPEISNAQELGVVLKHKPRHQHFEDLTANLALFRNTAFNKLIRSPFDPFTILSSTGRNVTNGIELSVRLKRLWKTLNVGAGMTLLDISDPVLYPFQPERQLNLQMEYFSEAGLYFSSTIFYEGKALGFDADRTEEIRSRGDLLPIQINSYNDIDLTVGYRFAVSGLRMNLQAAGYNLLDNSGYENYLLGKRNFHASLSIRY